MSEDGVSGPIFVVGSMRSGSTMLRLVLDSHPHIAIGAETGFMAALHGTKEIAGWKFGKDWYERLNWSEPEVDERLHDFYAGLFERYAAEQGKRRWGEKTPFHTRHLPEMGQVFPEAVFVGIVRHPGGVAASLRAKFHYGYQEALDYWTACNLELLRGGAGLGERFALCRYEDLVAEPESTLRELLGWLHEPWDPGVLAHHRVQREKGTARAVEGGTISSAPIDPLRAVQWTATAEAGDRDALAGVAALAGFFGYDPYDADRREPLAPQGPARGWLLSGTQLARRRADWQGQVDFDATPTVPQLDGDARQLAARLSQVEAALARTRNRRVVRMADAIRTVQGGRSLSDLRRAWALLHGA